MTAPLQPAGTPTYPCGTCGVRIKSVNGRWYHIAEDGDYRPDHPTYVQGTAVGAGWEIAGGDDGLPYENCDSDWADQ